MKQYIIVIERAVNNFSAFCPDVPGCITTGNTVEETAKNMKEALEFHLEALGSELPEAHDMKYLVTNGHFEHVVDECYISRIDIELPETV